MSTEAMGTMDVHKRMELIARKRGKIGLDRMRRLLEMLGNPEEKLNIIHVGGTNGKGSSTHFIKSILEAEGYNVGMFISPHLVSFNERIQTSAGMISDEDFDKVANKVMDYAEALNDEGLGFLSQSEILTAAAYLYFYEKKPDFVIMEVGIGGRCDSTNTVTKPLATLITQIGIDHTDMLGDTIEKITTEKSFIIKEGVPIVSESKEQSVKEILSKTASEKHARFIDASSFSYKIKEAATIKDGKIVTIFDAKILEKSYENLEISMLGEHQIKNAIASVATALMATSLSEKSIREGLKNAYNPGRFELLKKDPYMVIDGAHNENGIKASAAAFDLVFGKNNPKTLVGFGCLEDKDYAEMVELLCDFFPSADFLALEPSSNRALPASKLKELFETKGKICGILSKTEEIFCDKTISGYDVILVLGSIYLIGEVKELFLNLNNR